MSTIVTRAGKGSALTHNEVDANFTNLNTDKIEAAQSVTLTNKTISGSSNTLSNIGNSSLTNSSVTIGSTSVSLGSTATTVSGLTLSSPTVSGGTINNASVGATTPSTGSFTSLTDSGNLTFTGTGNRITGDFSNATTANRVMFQSSTTNGNTNLNAIPNGTSQQAVVGVFNNSDPTNASATSVLVNASESSFRAGITGTGTYLPMTFYTGGSERMRVDTSGNVGIGTNSPFSAAGYGALTINGTTGGITSYYVNGTETGRLQAVSGAFNVNAIGASTVTVFQTNGSERMRIDTSGNVGIGTSSPAVLLHAQSTTATTNAVTQALRIDSQSSGTPANGIGVGMQFATETAAGNTEIGATIEAITTDVTAASEDFDLSFKTMAAGAAAAERVRIKSTGDFQFNSGYGSVATAYGCRAWVNFDGTLTGTITPRASGNVTSVTKNGTGDYTINFTNAMPDANYCAVFGGQGTTGATYAYTTGRGNQSTLQQTTTTLRVLTANGANAAVDVLMVSVAIFR